MLRKPEGNIDPQISALECFQDKWTPVIRSETRSINDIGSDFDSIKIGKTLAASRRFVLPLALLFAIWFAPLAHAQDGNTPTGQKSGGVFAPGGHDVDQPVEISSDTLEVRQEEQLAIFLGNVDALQGEMRLTTDKLEVYYVTDEAGSDGSTQSISRMRATGSVFVTSPRETVRGDWADYNVISRTLSIHDNVLLSQGDNVICGQQLDMDVDTGISELTGGCNSGTQTATRVQGVFFPATSDGDGSD